MGQKESVQRFAQVRVEVVDVPGAGVTPGDWIRGNVVAAVAKPVQMGQVQVRAQGQWRVSVDAGADGGSQVVWKDAVKLDTASCGKDHVLQPGRHVLPFRFQVPKGTPPSTRVQVDSGVGGKKDKGEISFTLSAMVPKGWLWQNELLATAKFRVGTAPGLAPCAPQVAAVSSHLNHGFAFFRALGQVDVHVLYDASSGPGEEISVAIFMNNKSNTDVDFKSAKFTEVVKLRGSFLTREYKPNRSLLEPSQVKETLEDWVSIGEKDLAPAPPAEASSKVPFGTAGKKTCMRMRLMLPLNIQNCTVDTQHVGVSYRVDLKLSPRALFAEFIRVQLPVVVAKLPDGNFADEVAQTIHTAEAVDPDDAIPMATPVPAPTEAPPAYSAVAAGSGATSAAALATPDVHLDAVKPT
ncbi:Arrestin_N domain-containing protein [Durusdinium trenchii]|uniref:Arrestin_N domain-containing protein n=1 Tax=Durusdinium trenchii TaxID=1381693 RepID=A0ABP0RZ30_9DINO